MATKKKKMFEVLENETIDQCLNRMKNEGYQPIRRIERPVFMEDERTGEVKPIKREISFEGILIDK